MKILKLLVIAFTAIGFAIGITLLPSNANHNSPTNPSKSPATSSSAIISVEFDDGWKSAYNNALPILNRYKIKTTQAIISDANIGSSLYISDNEIRNWSNLGHEISSHSVTHSSLPSLDDTQLQSELKNSRNKLQKIINKRVRYFVAPYCEFESREINAAQKYYQASRGCFTDNQNTSNDIDITKLDSKIVVQTTTLDNLKSWINEAKENNSLLILVYHKIDNDNDTYSVSPQTFNSQMNIVAKSGLKIQTTMKALRTMGKI